MHIVIIGAGNVGYAIAKILADQHSVMVVERDEKRYEYVMNTLNVGVVNANGANPKVLRGVVNEGVDLFMAVTESDEANIFACLLAKNINPQVTTVARMKDYDYFEWDRSSGFVEVDQVLAPDALVAAKIKRIATLENVVDVDYIPATCMEIAKFRLTADRSGVTSIPYQHLPLPQNCKVLCIHRGKDTVVPRADDMFLLGDEIIVIGKSEAITAFDKVLGSARAPRDIVIVGGGVVSQYLVRMFEEGGLSVRLIEKDEDRCQELAQKFNRAIIINDNGADPLVLRSENVGMSDVLICATKSEESNLLASLVGKHLGVPKTITTYSRQEYKGIFHMAGIDSSISYHEVVANEIVKHTVPDYHVLMMMEGFKEELISLEVNSRCRIRGKMIGEIDLPDRSVIAMVITDGQAALPRADARILEGDTLLIYADKMDISALERIFSTNIPVDP
jgi:trk system potassium uptake protein TrkA